MQTCSSKSGHLALVIPILVWPMPDTCLPYLYGFRLLFPIPNIPFQSLMKNDSKLKSYVSCLVHSIKHVHNFSYCRMNKFHHIADYDKQYHRIETDDQSQKMILAPMQTSRNEEVAGYWASAHFNWVFVRNIYQHEQVSQTYVTS